MSTVLDGASAVRRGLIGGLLVHDFAGKKSPLALEVFDQSDEYDDTELAELGGSPIMIRVPGQMEPLEQEFAEYIAEKFRVAGFVVVRVKER